MAESLSSFYAGKNVLVTGATGFVGKVLLAKLLREFQDCTIYVLVRSTSKLTSQARLDQLLASPAFGASGAEAALKASQLVAVDGDLERDYLGLGQGYDELAAKLDVVLHCAALVDWGAPLHQSMRCNALGSWKMAQLAKAARRRHGKPCRLVCVSTAWVHGKSSGRCAELPPGATGGAAASRGAASGGSAEPWAELAATETRLAELQREAPARREAFLSEAQRRLGPSADAAALGEMAEEMGRKWLDAEMAEWGVQRARQKGWWDGYTFSKAMGEMLVAETQQDEPFAIVRPSGVVSAVSEPLPGWVDAYLLVEPLIEGVGRGQITEFPGRANCVIDCVPVDYVCNVIIAAARTSHEGGARVFQCASGDVHPNTLGEIEATWRKYFRSQPMLDNQGKPVHVQPVKFIDTADSFVRSLRTRYITPLQTCSQALQLVPLWQRSESLRSLRGWLERKKRTVEKVSQLARLYSTYTLNEWSFQTTNTRQLMSELTLEDRQRFPYFQGGDWNWEEFWTQKHIPGMRRWVLKEEVHSRL